MRSFVKKSNPKRGMSVNELDKAREKNLCRFGHMFNEHVE